MRRGLVFGICLALTAGAAPAAEPPGVPAPDAAKLAQAKAEGDAILARESAQGLFVNETGQGSGGLIILRHKASGFACVLSPGVPNGVQLYPSARPGEDVACHSEAGDVGYTMFMFKRPGQTNAQLLTTAEKEVQKDYPGAKTGQVETHAATASAPAYLVETLANDQRASRILIGQVGDWVLEYWASAPKDSLNLTAVDPFWVGAVGERTRYLTSPAALQAATATQALSFDQARALADAVIGKASAGDIFENATTGPVPTLRHKPSGFLCDLDTISADSNGITFFPGVKRGDDISCRSHPLGSVTDTFVTRRTGDLNQVAAAIVAAVKTLHPEMQAYQGQVVAIRPPEGATPTPRLTQRVTYMVGSTKVVSRLSVALVKGWMIEQRMDWPYDDAKNLAMDLMGETLIDREVERFAALPPALPAPAGNPV